jgi:hypothetical protein
MQVIITDGGRASSARWRGKAKGDCVTRAIAIVTGRSYCEVYDRLATGNATQRRSKRTGRRDYTADHGINTNRKWFKDYMAELGFVWVPIMGIGTGCTMHMRAPGEGYGGVPLGRLVVSLSRHYSAVIDGVCFDTHDPCRGGTRCVYGYWRLD